MPEFIISTLGWIGSVLIIGAYAANIKGYIKSDDKVYIWTNLVGGIFFVINTFYLKAYPSMVVNVVWVVIALSSVFKKKD
jgi:hypothetical protein